MGQEDGAAAVDMPAPSLQSGLMLAPAPVSIAEGSSVLVIGGGLGGTVCAAHIAAARPDLKIRIVERGERVGPGVAYGACYDDHLLNVPVNRLGIGVEPGFEAWLQQKTNPADLTEAAGESSGMLGDAFVQRRLFGGYLEEVARGLVASGRVTRIRGEAVSFLDHPRRGVLLADGREIAADFVVMALGNLPPRSPAPARMGLEDISGYIPDPWAPAALAGIAPTHTVLLVGSGLTMVDIALALGGRGHTGQMIALSRRGLLPARHAFGGQWPAFIGPLLPASPVSLVRALRDQISLAEEQGVPWQRVIDSIRPFVARIWRSWSFRQKRSFLRHLRTRWDVLRHRMAPRIAGRVDQLLAQGRLKLVSGRLTGCRPSTAGVTVEVAHGAGRNETIHACFIINCTGPRSDFDVVGAPLIADARRRGLIKPDALGLGIETESCAVISQSGAASQWLFAIGALTRPAWWEITAAPEITAQVLAFANSLNAQPQAAPTLEDRFQDLGAGI